MLNYYTIQSLKMLTAVKIYIYFTYESILFDPKGILHPKLKFHTFTTHPRGPGDIF